MSESEFGLKRVLGLFALVSIEVGFTIGAGIFVLTGYALSLTGPSLPLAFILAGILILLLMLSLAMLGSAIPCVGGTYRYPSRLFSSGWAFVGAWGYLLGMIFGTFPLYSLRAVEYLFQSFAYTPSFWVIQLCSALLLSFFYLVNLRGVELAGWVQIVMVVILLSALIFFSGKGMVKVNPENFHPLFPKGFSGLLAGSAVLTLALLGANSVIELGAEIKNPGRNIPLSLLISIPLVAVLYVAVAVVTVGVCPWQECAGKLLSEPAQMILGSAGFKFFLLGGAFLAITTSLNACFMCATKSLLVVSDDRLFPRWLCAVHPKYHTPHRFLTIIWLIGLLAIFFRVPAGTFETYASIGGLIIFIPLMISVLLFPKKLPRAYAQAPFQLRGFLLWLCPGLGMILSILAIFMLFTQLEIGWRWFFIFWLIGGALLYILQKKRAQNLEKDLVAQNIERDLRAWSELKPHRSPAENSQGKANPGKEKQDK